MSRSRSTFPHLDALLLALILISVFLVSSRPITTDPENHVSAMSLVLKSSDGEKFDVKIPVALQSETIKGMIAEGGFLDEMELSFPNITGDIMAKVLEYSNKHVYYADAANNMTAMEEMRAFDTQFVNVHHETLIKLVMAADYLKMKSLLDLTLEAVSNMMKGKSFQEIRNIFNIKNNLSPEEEDEMQRENAWAFESL